MQVASGVEMITVGEGAHAGVYAPNVYFVTGSRSAVFIDTAYGKDEEIAAHVSAWEAAGRPEVAAVILTHRHGDHLGGAVRLREATGGPIMCSAVEREAVDEALDGAKADRGAEDGEIIDLGGVTLELIQTPGHTMGSLCILHRQEGVLFTGDMILGTGTTVISPDHGDMTAYIESMRKLLNYESRMICPGHGPIIDTPQAKIQELIDHRLEREAQISGLIADGRDTIESMFESIYPDLHPGLHNTARSQIRSHLMKLERDGRVRPAGGDRYALS